MLTYATLFSGVGGWDQGLEAAGFGTPLWMCEIGAFQRKVLAKRYPGVRVYEDVRRLHGAGIHIGDSEIPSASGELHPRPAECPDCITEPPDILVASPPCQDLSVAGKRAGLAGVRSGLFFDFARIAGELRPEWVLLEQVPGLLSSNDGADFTVALDAIQDLGYAIESNILDARFFGVPQRRRRVFLICRDVERGRKAKWTYSLPLLTQALTEISALLLIAASGRSSTAPPNWASASTHSVDGLRRRMKLFGAETESGWSRLLTDWEDAEAKSASERSNSASPSTVPPQRPASIADSVRKAWAALYAQAKSFTTSTDGTTTIARTTSSCSLVVQTICALTLPSIVASPDSWNEDSSGLTALEVCTSYARPASNGIFGEVDRIPFWESAARFGTAHHDALLGLGGAPARSVLFESESRGGHPATGEPEREDTAHSLRARPNASLREDSDTYIPQVHGALTVRDNKGPRVDIAEPGFIVAHTLRASGFDASEDGTGRGTPLVPTLLTMREGKDGGGKGPLVSEDQSLTLATGNGQVLFDQPLAQITSKLNYSNSKPGDPQPPLNTLGQQHVAVAASVRRLTPTECERLMGWPDGWTCLCGVDPYTTATCTCPDGPRYSACGNGVVSSVAKWIGERIA